MFIQFYFIRTKLFLTFLQLSLVKRDITLQYILPQMFISKQTFKIQLQLQPQKRKKIKYLFPTYASSYVSLVGELTPEKDVEYIVHFDRKGNVKMKTLNIKISHMAMLSDRKILLISKKCNLIRIYDIEKEQWFDEENCFNQSTDKIQCFTFAQTQTFSIVETNLYNLRVAYYSFVSHEIEGTQINCLMKHCEGHEPFYVGRKVNNHSKIVWFQNLQKEEKEFISFKICYLDEKNRIKTEVFKTNLSVCNLQNEIKVNLIQDLWEISKDQYLVKCLAIFAEQNKKVKKSQFLIFNSFERNFHTIDSQKQFIYSCLRGQEFLFKVIGPFIFYSQRWSQNYITLNDKRIDIEDGIVMTINPYDRYKHLPWQFNSFSLSFQYSIKSRDLAVEHVKQINLKNVFMQFLMYFNQDFDDDLLLDVIRLLFE